MEVMTLALYQRFQSSVSNSFGRHNLQGKFTVPQQMGTKPNNDGIDGVHISGFRNSEPPTLPMGYGTVPLSRSNPALHASEIQRLPTILKMALVVDYAWYSSHANATINQLQLKARCSTYYACSSRFTRIKMDSLQGGDLDRVRYSHEQI